MTDDVFSRRAQRHAQLEAENQARLAIDTEELIRLEDLHGINNVCSVQVPYVNAGTPVLLIARGVNKLELKRYRDTTAADKSKAFDAACAVVACTLLYPDKETLDRILVDRPGVVGQLGVASVELGLGTAEQRAKK